MDDNQLDAQLQLEKYERECQQQEVVGRTTPITISDEEQLAKGAKKDTDEPRQTAIGVESTVTTEGETIAITEEQPCQPVIDKILESKHSNKNQRRA